MKFLKGLISAEAKDVSSKRFSGILCIVIFCLILMITFIVDRSITPDQQKLMLSLLSAGTLLLGAGLFDKV
jgi:hypothetical protein